MSAELINIFYRHENDRWWSYIDEDRCDNIEVAPFDIDEHMDDYHLLYPFMTVKHYIKIGDECSICLDPIIHKTYAFLTECGHSFHRKCMYQLCIYSKNNGLKCPICRSGLLISLNINYSSIIPTKYCNISSSKRSLDKLEVFWNHFDLLHPHICPNDHYLGMNKDCKYCIKYIKTGKIKK